MAVTEMAARSWSVGCLLVCLLVVSACSTSSTPDAGSPTQTATAAAPRFTAAPTPASPRRLPGSVVRVSVNGVENTADVAVRDPGPGPITIVLTFPFAVDRASVDQWGMSGRPIRTWLDDRTLQLVFAETEPSIGFKFPETLSASGDASIDFVVVNVPRSSHAVNIYAVADLAATGMAGTARTSGSWRIPAADGYALAPDATRMLLYDALGQVVGPRPTLLELDTRKSTPLTQQFAGEDWFAFADWMADGRLVMIGRGVWVGDLNGNDMKRIADTQALVRGAVWLAVPDPSLKRVALWGYNSDGHIAVVDITSGAAQLVSGPFRRCVADGATSFAWSADGRLLAGTDCDSEEGPGKARVRIVDVATDRTVRTIEGGAYGITGLSTGDFIVVRESGETGAGSRHLGLVMSFDGQERGRYLGGAWRMSPDARYLLQSELSPAGCCGFTMLDLTARTSFEFVVQSGGQSDGGRGQPHWMRDGRLAYY
jgi:hypothetical protein